ncbi:MAG: isopentenyl phosphate kinase [Candidatus Diapherotrites archaeon]
MLVKLGGSLITDKTKRECLDKKTLARLCREIHSARKKKKIDLIVGHGGGSFPHYPAHKYKVKEGITGKNSLKGFALTSDAAARLNRLVVKELIKSGENAVSVQPSAWLLAENGKIGKAFTEQFKQYLEKGFLPVPYGDAVLDSKKGITIVSTEQILGELAIKLKAKKLIVATNTKGVFTSNPLKDKKAKFIPLIERKNFEKIKKMLKGSHGTDVTGGMLHKVEELVELAGKGVECSIISGKKKGNLEKALLGKKTGTIIR